MDEIINPSIDFKKKIIKMTYVLLLKSNTFNLLYFVLPIITQYAAVFEA